MVDEIVSGAVKAGGCSTAIVLDEARECFAGWPKTLAKSELRFCWSHYAASPDLGDVYPLLWPTSVESFGYILTSSFNYILINLGSRVVTRVR